MPIENFVIMEVEEIIKECDVAWQEKFLELTGLKIGDKVVCAFFPKNGDSNSCYTSSIMGTGVIVRTDKGVLVQSVNKYIMARETKMYPNRPYSTKTYWKYTEENLYSELKYIKLN